jgi:hypothetical protein
VRKVHFIIYAYIYENILSDNSCKNTVMKKIYKER